MSMVGEPSLPRRVTAACLFCAAAALWRVAARLLPHRHPVRVFCEGSRELAGGAVLAALDAPRIARRAGFVSATFSACWITLDAMLAQVSGPLEWVGLTAGLLG